MKRRRRRWLPVLWVLLVLVTGISVNLYLALRPEALQARVRAALRKALAYPPEFDSLQLNWRGVAEVNGFRLLAEEDGVEVVRAGTIRAFPRLLALLTGRFEVDLLVMQDLELTVVRDRDGRWNLDRLLRPREGGGDVRLPDTVIERCHLYYSDATFTPPVVEEISDLRLVLVSGETGVVNFQGEFRDEPVGKLVVKGRCDVPPRQPRVDLEFQLFQLDLSARYHHFLPASVASKLRTLNLEGHLENVSGGLLFDKENGLQVTNLGGSLVGCQLAPAALPFPLEGLSGRFHVGGRTVRLDGLRGDFGGGLLEAQATFELLQDSYDLKGWNGSVTVSSFPLDRRLHGLVPPELQNILNLFQPQGEVGLELKVDSSQSLPPPPNELYAALHVQGADFRYRRFPYLVEDVRGKIVFRDGLLRLDGLQGRCGGGVVVSEGFIDPRRGGAIDVNLRVEGEPGLRLDERFRNALPSNIKSLWDDFQPSGVVSGEIRIDRADATAGGEHAERARERIHITARPREARIAYRRFPYEVQDISGEIIWDSFEKQVQLKLEGYHASQEIAARGAVKLGEDPRFQVTISCDSLAVDEALVNALSVEGRRLLRDFGFAGRVGATVEIFEEPGQGVQVITDLDILEGSIEHVKFRYPIQLSAGHVTVRNTQFIRFTDFRGYREVLAKEPSTSADGEEPEPPQRRTLDVGFAGSLSLGGSERRLIYDFDIAKLSIDRRLLEALPAVVQRFFTNFGLRGNFRGRLEGSYFFDEKDPSRESVTYQAEDVATTDASVDFGLEFKELTAKLRFSGSWKAGEPHRLEGDVTVEESWFNRLRLTNGEIVFVFGQVHPAILEARTRKEEKTYRPPEMFVRRLAGNRVHDTFQMSIHSDDVYGGEVDGFLFVDTGEVRDLGGDFVGRGLKISRASKDIFGVEGQDVKGTAAGKVFFEGRTNDFRSIRGQGFGVIKDARLMELPLFLGLLSILNLNFKEAAGKSYFNELSLPYTIEDGIFRSSTIAVLSPGIKLYGGGTMDDKGNLDLDFQPRLFNFQIPLIEQVFSLVKGGLAQVHVGGNLSKPKIEFRTAASLVRIPVEPPPPPERRLPSDLREKQ